MTEPAVALGDKGLAFEDAMFDIVKAQDTIGETDGELKRIVTGYAAVADVVDSQYEIIAKEALEEASKDLLQYTTVLYNHDADRPIGKVLEARPEGTGLFVKVQISSTEDEIWNKITEGIISKFSFRGTVTDYTEQYDKSLDRYITVIKGFRVFEISLVSVPANPHARTLHHYLSKALEESRKTDTQSQENPKAEKKTPKRGGLRKTMADQDLERMKLIASLCDKLITALQDMPHVDPRLIAVAKRIKSEAQAAASEEGSEGEGASGANKYPQPAPAEAGMDIEHYDPAMEGMKSRMATAEEKLTGIEKSITDLSETLTTSITETVKSMTETMVNERLTQLDEKFDSQSDVIKSFAELLDSLRPVLGLEPLVEKAAEEPTKTEDETNKGGET